MLRRLRVDALAVELEKDNREDARALVRSLGVPVVFLSSINAWWLGHEAMHHDLRLRIAFRPRWKEYREAVAQQEGECSEEP